MNISNSSNWFERRISELKEEQEEVCSKLQKICLKTKSLESFLEIKQVESEKKVLLRKKTETNIRIRNLERDLLNCSNRSARNDSIHESKNDSSICDKSCDDKDKQYELIDFEDIDFNPTEEEFNHERPYPTLRPTRSLPHSNMRWKYGRRVGLWKENYVLGMNTTLNDYGQFTSVEDEDEPVNWDNMTIGADISRSSNNTKHKYRSKLIPDDKMTVIKPKLERLVESRKPNIVQLVRKLSVTEDCICSRPPKPIICSGGCNYSFIGRLKLTCQVHPADQYLMDHSPLCPQCKSSLVEESNDVNVKLPPERTSNGIEASVTVYTPVLVRKSRSKRLSTTTIHQL